MKKHDYIGRKSLVLNADYTAFAIISARRALRDSIKYQFEPTTGLQAVDYYPNLKVLAGHGRYFPIPSVVRMIEYKKLKGKISFNRRNLFIRDNMTCMYCGHRDITLRTLTRDHVIPLAIWRRQKHSKTPTDWLNIVTCCRSCNTRKGNRTPAQAGMKLRMEPFEPTAHNYIRGFNPWMVIDPTWYPYLPKNYKILIEKQNSTV